MNQFVTFQLYIYSNARENKINAMVESLVHALIFVIKNTSTPEFVKSFSFKITTYTPSGQVYM